MIISTLLFGILTGCWLAVLVGILGSRRRIGFGWAFLISLVFTPVVGLIVALITDPLPGNEKRWGCIGTLMAIIGIILLSVFVFLLATGAAVLAF